MASILTDKMCAWCEDVPATNEDYNVPLCDDCTFIYDNKTGFCSLHCCMSGQCDDSC